MEAREWNKSLVPWETQAVRRAIGQVHTAGSAFLISWREGYLSGCWGWADLGGGEHKVSIKTHEELVEESLVQEIMEKWAHSWQTSNIMLEELGSF